MSTITTRSGKGSPLTNNEVDANFTNLNTDKLESGDLSVATTAVGTASLTYNSGVFTYTPPDLTAIDLSLYAPLAGAVFTGTVEAPLFEGDLSGAQLFPAKAGEALTKGDALYISGISGNKPVVMKADANDPAKMPSFGLAGATVSNNENVNCITYGQIHNVDTTAFSLGDQLYVSTTAGALTSTAPTGETSQIQNLAKVERVHASTGALFVAGSGRANATPNLNDGNFFLGNASNQAVSADFTTAVRGEISAGTGIGLSGGVISNTAPDQTVALTGAGATSISGTYPNFTISSVNTTYSVGDGGLTEINFTSADHTKLNGIATGAEVNVQSNWNATSGDSFIANKPTIPTNNNQLTNGAGYVTANTTYTAGSGLSLTGTVFANTAPDRTVALTGAGATSISGTYPNFLITSANTTYSVGDGGLTEINFTSADHAKLNGIASGANNYSLPLATNSVRGGIELFSNTDQSVAANGITTTANRTYGIQLNSANQAVVNVPWSDTNTVYSLPLASSSTRGGVKIGYSENGKNYPVELSSEKMFVNVPWANTTYSVGDGGLTQKNFTTTLKTKLDGIATSANNYSLPLATDTVRGGIELFSNTDQSVAANSVTNTASRTYGIQLNSANQAVVNVPWVNTTYSVGDGGLSQINFTSADHTKLNGIAVNANNYSFPYTIATSSTANAVVRRDASGDINARLFRSEYDSTNASCNYFMTQVDTSSNNYMRPSTPAQVRTALNVENGATADQTAAEILTAIKTVDGAGSGLDADLLDGLSEGSFMRRSANSQLDMNNFDILGVDQIFHEGDTNTYMQFHAADQWRVVTGGAERLEVNNSAVTVAGNMTVSGTLTVRTAIDLADNDILRFGSSDDTEFFCDGSHMYMDLNAGIGNFYIRDDTTTRFTFDDAGHFTATGNVTAYSDIRLKEDIKPIEDAVSKVQQLTGNTYTRNDLKNADRRYGGVIAQEVEVVLPEAVSESEDGTKTVDYNAVIALLVESVKELKEEIETLKGNA